MMWAQHPAIARRWSKTYGPGKDLPFKKTAVKRRMKTRGRFVQ